MMWNRRGIYTDIVKQNKEYKVMDCCHFGFTTATTAITSSY